MSDLIAVLDPEWSDYTMGLAAAGVDALGFGSPADIRLESDPVRILVGRPDLAAEAMHDLPELRWFQSTWAGVEPVLNANPPESLTITKATDVFGPAMREFVFGHLLAWAQRVTERSQSRSWDPTLPTLLVGARMGIMGTGSIGRAIAETAQHLGLNVVGLSRTGDSRAPFDRVFPVTAAEHFANGLDHLVAALPATEQTRRLVNRAVLENLQQGATFINVGRGATVDPNAVVEALTSGRLVLSVLDVFEEEPLDADSPLWQVPNLIITSHTAASTRPGDIVDLFLDNLERWRAGSPLRGVVDVESGY